MLPQQQLHRHAGRKLIGSAADAPVTGIVGLEHLPGSLGDCLPRDHLPFRGFVEIRENPGDLGRVVHQVPGLLPPEPGHLLQHGLESGPSVVVLAGEIGSGEERLAVRRQPDALGPAAVPARIQHGGVHVNLVQVGPLLPVHFDRNEMLVQETSHFLVLKTFVLHHMAPVAGSVTDAQKNGLVLVGGQTQRLRPPRVPVHGIVRVLQQIGAGRVDEAIRMFVFQSRC